MIFHDRINLVISVSGTDPDGYPTTVETVLEGVPAEVIPLSSDLTISEDRSAVTTRYRVIITRAVNIPADAGDGVRVQWGPAGVSLPADLPAPFTPDLELLADGAIERHYLRGRLHHYEVLVKTFTT